MSLARGGEVVGAMPAPDALASLVRAYLDDHPAVSWDAALEALAKLWAER